MSTRTTLPDHVPAVWSRRRLLASLALGGLAAPTLASLLAACGDPSTAPGTDTSTPDTSTPDTSTPDTVPTTGPEPGITHPSGPDTAVLRLSWEGGMLPAWMAMYPPSLLVSGDGRAFVPGVVPEIYPGPLVSPVMVRSITEAGVQTILAMLRDEGLFVEPTPTYDVPDGFGIADASTTVLTFTAEGATHVHSAYALGFEPGLDSTPDRDRLWSVVQRLGDLPGLVGASVGTEELFVPEAWRFAAIESNPAEVTGPPDPTVVPWPKGTGVVLAEVAYPNATGSVCATVSAEAVGDLFTSANQLTFFEEDGVTYQMSVTPVLPGDAAC